jgi:hypothetical protein
VGGEIAEAFEGEEEKLFDDKLVSAVDEDEREKSDVVGDEDRVNSEGPGVEARGCLSEVSPLGGNFS